MTKQHQQTIVLIHPFPTDQQLWQPQQALQSHFQVITLDLKGFGSAPPTDGSAITMTEYADQVKHLLDEHHIKKAIIAGESMGGYIALAFLKKYPAMVEGLILSGTQSIADSDEAKIKRETSAKDILSNGIENFLKGFLPKALSSHAAKKDKHTLETICFRQAPGGLASALRGMALREDTSDVLVAHPKLPVLIITGAEDDIVSPEQSKKMHELAANSQLKTIPNAGHLASLEQAESWNQAVIYFFSG